MKRQKKARRRLGKAAQLLQQVYTVATVDKSQVAVATGAFALGTLATALARDPEVRAHSRALAKVVLDRLVGLITDRPTAPPKKRRQRPARG